MVQPVVAGVDGSEESLAAAEWAAREAVRRDRPLRLVHAWAWHPRRTAGEPVNAALRHQARHCLRQATERVRATCPDLRLVHEQAEGPATAALLRAAGKAELLVLGSRGLSGFTGFLVGSVALGVVARADCPVVLVRAGEEAADEHLPADGGDPSVRTGYRDVVVGLDVTEPGDEILEFAFETALLRHARLRVVHAWRAPGPLALGPGEVALMDERDRAREWRGFVTAFLQVWRDKYPDVEVLETAVADKPANALIRAATGAGLLVVGRRSAERPVGPRTGPVAHAALQYVDCPVAVVPHT
jgi:nucleotide-binding universal stress UspA family protein